MVLPGSGSQFTVLQFLQQHNGTMADIHDRAIGVYRQVSLNAILFVIFVQCTYHAVPMVVKKPRAVAQWCCLLLSVMGACVFGTALSTNLIDSLDCVGLTVNFGTGVGLAPMFINIVLLERVYIAYARRRWILIGGGLLVVASPPIFIGLIWQFSTISYLPGTGCNVVYPDWIAYVRLVTDIPINLGFSVAFISFIYLRYRRLGGACWRELARDGTKTTAAILASNIICLVLIASRAFGGYTDMIYLFDWIICTMLLLSSISHLETVAQREA